MSNIFRLLHLNTFSFFKKKSYLLFLAIFLILSGFFFFEYIHQIKTNTIIWNDTIVSPVLGNIHFLFLLFTPVIVYLCSSFIFSEQGRQFADFFEISNKAGVFSQYLFCLSQVFLLHLMIFPFFFYLFHLGYNDWSFILNLFVTLFLICSAISSICFYIRSKVRNPLVYMTFCLGIICFFYTVNLAGNLVKNFVLIEFFKSISFSVAFDTALSGVVSVKKSFFLLSISFSFLFFSISKFSQKRKIR